MTNNLCWAEVVARLHAQEQERLKGIDPELPKQIALDAAADVYTEDELR